MFGIRVDYTFLGRESSSRCYFVSLGLISDFPDDSFGDSQLEFVYARSTGSLFNSALRNVNLRFRRDVQLRSIMYSRRKGYAMRQRLIDRIVPHEYVRARAHTHAMRQSLTTATTVYIRHETPDALFLGMDPGVPQVAYQVRALRNARSRAHALTHAGTSRSCNTMALTSDDRPTGLCEYPLDLRQRI